MDLTIELHGIGIDVTVELGDPGRPSCDMYPAEPADDHEVSVGAMAVEDQDDYMEWLWDAIGTDTTSILWPLIPPTTGRVLSALESVRLKDLWMAEIIEKATEQAEASAW